MAHSSDQDILTVLDAAGPQWAELQAWRVTSIEGAANGAITVHGPAFIYRWENGLGPVKVSFWTQQEGRIPSGPGHLLAIEPGLGTIRLKLPGREPMVIGAVEPAIYQQIGELTVEAQSAVQGQGGEKWSRDLILVAAAMKLAALTR
jgi:hypothetical protein